MDALLEIKRLTGELIAALVREFGPDHAARLLEYTAAEIRATCDLYPSLYPKRKRPFRAIRKSLF